MQRNQAGLIRLNGKSYNLNRGKTFIARPNGLLALVQVRSSEVHLTSYSTDPIEITTSTNIDPLYILPRETTPLQGPTTIMYHRESLQWLPNATDPKAESIFHLNKRNQGELGKIVGRFSIGDQELFKPDCVIGASNKLAVGKDNNGSKPVAKATKVKKPKAKDRNKQEVLKRIFGKLVLKKTKSSMNPTQSHFYVVKHNHVVRTPALAVDFVKPANMDESKQPIVRLVRLKLNARLEAQLLKYKPSGDKCLAGIGNDRKYRMIGNDRKRIGNIEAAASSRGKKSHERRRRKLSTSSGRKKGQSSMTLTTAEPTKQYMSTNNDLPSTPSIGDSSNRNSLRKVATTTILTSPQQQNPEMEYMTFYYENTNQSRPPTPRTPVSMRRKRRHGNVEAAVSKKQALDYYDQDNYYNYAELDDEDIEKRLLNGIENKECDCGREDHNGGGSRASNGEQCADDGQGSSLDDEQESNKYEYLDDGKIREECADDGQGSSAGQDGEEDDGPGSSQSEDEKQADAGQDSSITQNGQQLDGEQESQDDDGQGSSLGQDEEEDEAQDSNLTQDGERDNGQESRHSQDGEESDDEQESSQSEDEEQEDGQESSLHDEEESDEESSLTQEEEEAIHSKSEDEQDNGQQSIQSQEEELAKAIQSISCNINGSLSIGEVELADIQEQSLCLNSTDLIQVDEIERVESLEGRMEEISETGQEIEDTFSNVQIGNDKTCETRPTRTSNRVHSADSYNQAHCRSSLDSFNWDGIHETSQQVEISTSQQVDLQVGNILLPTEQPAVILPQQNETFLGSERIVCYETSAQLNSSCKSSDLQAEEYQEFETLLGLNSSTEVNGFYVPSNTSSFNALETYPQFTNSPVSIPPLASTHVPQITMAVQPNLTNCLIQSMMVLTYDPVAGNSGSNNTDYIQSTYNIDTNQHMERPSQLQTPQIAPNLADGNLLRNALMKNTVRPIQANQTEVNQSSLEIPTQSLTNLDTRKLVDLVQENGVYGQFNVTLEQSQSSPTKNLPCNKLESVLQSGSSTQLLPIETSFLSAWIALRGTVLSNVRYKIVKVRRLPVHHPNNKSLYIPSQQAIVQAQLQESITSNQIKSNASNLIQVQAIGKKRKQGRTAWRMGRKALYIAAAADKVITPEMDDYVIELGEGFRCNLCNVDVPKDVNVHLLGKRHQKNLKKEKEISGR